MMKAVVWLFSFCVFSRNAQSLELTVGKPVTFFTYTNEDKIVQMFIPGMVIDQYVIQHCIDHQILPSRDDCIEYGDTVSYNLYNSVHYTPSRLSNPTIEDMYTARYDILEYLQNTFKYESYLEIGCDKNQSFGLLKDKFSKRSVCVDPNKGGSIRMTSDEFFAQNVDSYDLIFIDGLHTATQVLYIILMHPSIILCAALSTLFILLI